MLSGTALDPRLAGDHREQKMSKALVKEIPVSSECDSSFDLSEPESPVIRPLDVVGHHMPEAELSPLNLDDSDSESDSNEQANSSQSSMRFELPASYVIERTALRRPRVTAANPRRIRLIKDFIESELRIQHIPNLNLSDEESSAQEECF